MDAHLLRLSRAGSFGTSDQRPICSYMWCAMAAAYVGYTYCHILGIFFGLFFEICWAWIPGVNWSIKGIWQASSTIHPVLPVGQMRTTLDESAELQGKFIAYRLAFEQSPKP